MTKKYRNPGLALGGGAAYGTAHIGVLKAIEELGIQPEFVSGTSIGSFVAALYAFGTPVEKIEEIGLNLDWLDVSGLKLSKLGLLSNERLGQVVLDHLGDVDIEDSKIPISIIATDICSGEKVVMNSGSLSEAIMASVCIPGLFIPVEMGEKLLVDGGLCENVPAETVKNMGAKDVIAVDLTTNRSYKCPDDIIDVLMTSFDIGLNNLINEQIDDKDILLIQPELTAYNRADIEKSSELIDKGYDAAMAVLV